MSTIGVNVVFSAVNAMSQGLAVIGSSLSQLGGGFASVGTIMTAFAAGPAAGVGAIIGEIIGVSQQAVSAFGSFEAAMTRVVAATGLTGEAAVVLEAELREVAETMGVEFGVGATGAAQALEALVKAGMEGDEAVKALRATLQMATIEGMNTGEAAGYVVQALNMFGMAADQASTMVDILTNASMKGVGTVRDYAVGLSYCGKTFASYGFSAQEACAALVMLDNQGISAEKAGRYLDAMMRDLTSTTVDLGFEIYNADGSMKSLAEIVALLEGKMQGLSTEERVAYLESIGLSAQSARAVAALTALTAEGEAGSDALSGLADAMGASGTAAGMAEKQMSTYEGAMAKMRASVENLFIHIGEKLAPVIEAFAKIIEQIVPIIDEVIGGFFEWADVTFGPLIEQFQIFWDQIGGVKGAFEGLLAVVEPVLTPIRQIIEDIVGAVAGWIEEMGGLQAILAPIGAVFHAIFTAIGTVTQMVWGFVKGFVEGLWTGLKPALEALKPVVEAVFNAFSQFYEGIKPLTPYLTELGRIIGTAVSVPIQLVAAVTRRLYDVWCMVWPYISDVLTTAWEGVIKPIFEALVAFWNNYLKPFLEALRDLWFTVWKNNIEPAIKGVWEGIIKPIFEAIWNFWITYLKPFILSLRDLWVEVWGRVGPALQAAWSIIKPILDAIVSAINAVSGALESLSDWWEEIFGGSPGGQIEESLKHALKATRKYAGLIGRELEAEVGFAGGIPVRGPTTITVKGPLVQVGSVSGAYDVKKMARDLKNELDELSYTELRARRRPGVPYS